MTMTVYTPAAEVLPNRSDAPDVLTTSVERVSTGITPTPAAPSSEASAVEKPKRPRPKGGPARRPSLSSSL